MRRIRYEPRNNCPISSVSELDGGIESSEALAADMAAQLTLFRFTMPTQLGNLPGWAVYF